MEFANVTFLGWKRCGICKITESFGKFVPVSCERAEFVCRFFLNVLSNYCTIRWLAKVHIFQVCKFCIFRLLYCGRVLKLCRRKMSRNPVWVKQAPNIPLRWSRAPPLVKHSFLRHVPLQTWRAAIPAAFLEARPDYGKLSNTFPFQVRRAAVNATPWNLPSIPSTRETLATGFSTV